MKATVLLLYSWVSRSIRFGLLFCVGLLAGCSTTSVQRPLPEAAPANVQRPLPEAAPAAPWEHGIADLGQGEFEVDEIVRSGSFLDFDGTHYMELILTERCRERLVVVLDRGPREIYVRLGALSEERGTGFRIVPAGPEATALAGALARGSSRFGAREADNALILIEALSGRPRPPGLVWRHTRSVSHRLTEIRWFA